MGARAKTWQRRRPIIYLVRGSPPRNDQLRRTAPHDQQADAGRTLRPPITAIARRGAGSSAHDTQTRAAGPVLERGDRGNQDRTHARERRFIRASSSGSPRPRVVEFSSSRIAVFTQPDQQDAAISEMRFSGTPADQQVSKRRRLPAVPRQHQRRMGARPETAPSTPRRREASGERRQ